MLSVDEIEDILSTGHETRSLEAKGPGRQSDRAFFVKVVRAALSMGNQRDGGHVVIGIGDDDPASLGPGLSVNEIASWASFDEVSRALAVYADPPLSFEIKKLELSSGAKVVVLAVHEFEDVPHLCAKGYEGTLRKGALYVRTRKLPETAEIASSVEMRDILHLATEKALRAYVSTAKRAGIELGLNAGSGPGDDRNAYTEELQRAWA